MEKIVKISNSMEMEFSVIKTNAPYGAIELQIMENCRKMEEMEEIVNQYELLENNGYYMEEITNSDITTDLENIDIDLVLDLCDY